MGELSGEITENHPFVLKGRDICAVPLGGTMLIFIYNSGWLEAKCLVVR